MVSFDQQTPGIVVGPTDPGFQVASCDHPLQRDPRDPRFDIYCNSLQVQINDLTSKVAHYKDYATRAYIAYEREITLSQKLMEALMDARNRLSKHRRCPGTTIKSSTPSPSSSMSYPQGNTDAPPASEAVSVTPASQH
jgi:hypothetical protein